MFAEQGRKKTEKTLSFFFNRPIQKSQSHNTTINQNVELVHFSVEELTQSTNEFANQLGERGGFRSNFRGVIPENNPHNLPMQNVAVKWSHFKNTRDVAKRATFYHSGFHFLQVFHL